MHIPDGFLNNSTAGLLLGVTVLAEICAGAKVRKDFFEKIKVPVLKTVEGFEFGSPSVRQLTKSGKDKIFKMATVGAFIFAAQMVNFPVASGTSGHLLGGVLAGILLGPLEGLLVISSVLTVQSLFFADGGLLALGANIFNMGIIGAIGGYYLYLLFSSFQKNFFISAALAAWSSVILASIVCSLELAISGTIPLVSVLPSMVGIHALIGIGEALITVFVLWFMKYQPEGHSHD
ncbi:MAG: energy-coupling factor ABC transporter permease [Patescibacteria group bacterium]|jgi:cobalt/nickel transport system permease protein|nr:energy-coupling factor ABC transporter permease [Patescibacteria group bacterium]